MDGEKEDFITYTKEKLEAYFDRHLDYFVNATEEGERSSLIERLNKFCDSEFFRCSWNDISECGLKRKLRETIFQIKETHRSFLGEQPA